MADEKDIIVEFLKGKSASKSKFYFKDFTDLFPDKGPREVKKILTRLVNEEVLEFWSSGSTTRSRDRDGRKYHTVCRQIPFRSMCSALPHRNAASHRGISVFRTDATPVRRRQGALPRVSSPAVCGDSAPGVSRPAFRRRQGWARACASPSASCLRRAALLYCRSPG